MIVTARGHSYWLKVHEIPEASRNARGKPIINLLALGETERIAAIVPVRIFAADRYLMFVSRRGVVKKTELAAYRHVRAAGVNAINITDDDELIDVQVTSGDDQIVLATRQGIAIRFHEWDVRSMGRVATGVRGIRLRDDDAVIGMVVTHPDTNAQTTLLVVTQHGRGKRTAIDDYRLQSRGGMGVINLKLNEQTGTVIAIKAVSDEDELMLITKNGIVNRQRVNEIRVIGRATQGVRLVQLDEGDTIMDVASVVRDDEEPEAVLAEGTAPTDGEPDGDSPDDSMSGDFDGDVTAGEDAELAAAGFVDDGFSDEATEDEDGDDA
jgi:DNA gyrase subunit A